MASLRRWRRGSPEICNSFSRGRMRERGRPKGRDDTGWVDWTLRKKRGSNLLARHPAKWKRTQKKGGLTKKDRGPRERDRGRGEKRGEN